MKPFQIFAKKFSIESLRSLFDEKISETKAIGRDGIRTSQFVDHIENEVSLISKNTKSGNYKFTRYKAKLISKGPFKEPRMLSIPTVRDRLTLRALCEFMAEVYPEAITRKPHEYIKNIKEELAGADLNAAFLRIDVRDYYPSVDRELLIKDIKKKIRKQEAISLIEKAISTETFKAGEKGIPQGLSISNILANIYLLEFDMSLKKYIKYYRYVDDILMICGSTAHAQDVFKEVKWRLEHQRHLLCHDLGDKSKSCISSVQHGVDYLGFHVSKSKISVRQSSLRKMISSIISIFSKFKPINNDTKLLWLLNLRITGCRFEEKNYGWMFFFLQTEDTSQLSRLDRLVRLQLNKNKKYKLIGKQKTFIKTFHELRFKGIKSKYIPNFDEITFEDMVNIICTITGIDKRKLEEKGEKFVRSEFKKIIKKEVSVLERDIMESFS